jgi:hypothetical protein
MAQPAEAPLPPKSVERPRFYLADLSGEYETKQLADAKIACQGETFEVHRFVVCKRSKFFCEAFLKEPCTCTVAVDIFPPDPVDLLLRSLYAGRLLTVPILNEYDLIDYVDSPVLDKGEPCGKISVPKWGAGSSAGDDMSDLEPSIERRDLDHVNEKLVSSIKLLVLADYFEVPFLQADIVECVRKRIRKALCTPCSTISVRRP